MHYKTTLAIKKISLIAFLLIAIIACEEVVDVDLETAKERLVIEALIKWESGTLGNKQAIKLTKTASYYTNEIVAVNNADVVVKNIATEQEFVFEITSEGIYETTTFIPEINTEYELTVSYNNEVYKATSTLLEAPEVLEVTQSLEEGFSEEEPEITIYFQDFENQEDFYRTIFEHYRPSDDDIDDVDDFIFDDSFQENNIISVFYESENLQTDDEITYTIYKISERFYDYLDKLGNLEDGDLGPFSSPPINLKGNIVNTTTFDNYPYGYFSLNKITVDTYVFE